MLEVSAFAFLPKLEPALARGAHLEHGTELLISALTKARRLSVLT
jgi:hypothetical protein